jgi:hypothetical protein
MGAAGQRLRREFGDIAGLEEPVRHSVCAGMPGQGTGATAATARSTWVISFVPSGHPDLGDGHALAVDHRG